MKKARHRVRLFSWQGIVFQNQTFDDELEFDITEVEQIFDDSDEETK